MASLEHIYSLINAKSLEDHLRKYRDCGFFVSSQTVRHPPGLRNGFVYIGYEYIEFEWVEDRITFNKGKTPYLAAFRKHPWPFGFGFEEPLIEEFHTKAKASGFKIPEMYSRGPSDSQKGRKSRWTFQDVPAKLVPGVVPFVLRYETRDYRKGRKAYCGPNGIFAISALTFVCKNPKRDASRWHSFFGPGSSLNVEKGIARFTLGAHELEWMTASRYADIYKHASLVPSDVGLSIRRTVALLHVLSENLDETERALVRGGRNVTRADVSGEKVLIVSPLKNDGFSFLVRRGSLSSWRRDRRALGQMTVVAHSLKESKRSKS